MYVRSVTSKPLNHENKALYSKSDVLYGIDKSIKFDSLLAMFISMKIFSGYNGYNNMHGGYGANRYGMGCNNVPSSSFVEQAEQNSRTAFDSVHSIVQAFGSIAMMLESTFFAVHSSFRAVLGVADHFSRLRENLVQIVGENFLIKWIQSVFRKIMVLLGLRSSASVEEVWNQMRSMAQDTSKQQQSRVWKSWPLLLFFGVVLGTPWLIWRFLSSLGNEDIHNWKTGMHIKIHKL